MSRRVSLDQRIAAHMPDPPARRVTRAAFLAIPRGGLRARMQRSLDDAVQIFELDRLLYDIEVDAQHEWLRRLMAFDAYCARRDAGDL
jgi:hypothetical protein